jgi:predicted DNA-binding ribbon-helix-helix protein
MLASFPASMVNQRSTDLGIPNRFRLNSSRFSISLEDAFWNGLKEIAASRDVPLPYLVEQIDRAREHDNLSSAIRLFVLEHYKEQTSRNQRTPSA